MNTVKAAVWVALLAGISTAALKNVAVVETEVDRESGAVKLSKAEVRLVTAELRREAVNNLPRDRYNIMTSETVYSQLGSEKLGECADENCVIALGSKIGADYIVRGTVSKIQTWFSLAVEMYETENGNLVASSKAVRSENIVELVEKAAAACAEMYRTFVSSQNSAPQQKPARPAYTVTVNPTNGGYVSRNPNKTVYEAGEQLILTAAAYDGYAFTGWSGDVIGDVNPGMVTVNHDMTLAANFQYARHARQTYTLTTTVFPQGGGYVTRNPDKETYAPGEEVTVMATPENYYKFIDWTGAVSSRVNYVTIRMDGNKTLTANFYRQSVESSSRRTLSDATGGSVDSRSAGAGTEGYYIGVSAPLFATPALGGEWAGIEGGWFGNNRMAYGFEFGGGVWGDAHNSTNPLAGVGYRETVGGGFNVSHVGNRWVLGWSTGYWRGRFELEDYPTPLQTVNVFGGPFIKLRFWNICELSYRGLMGYKQDGSYDSYNSTFILDDKKEFTLASQLRFGLRFEIAGNSTKRSVSAYQQTGGNGSGTLTDSRDGRTYRTVVIGGKRWMAENLNYQTSGGSWCYKNKYSKCDEYGRLYDWNTAKTVCPEGWHLPDNQEWDNLIDVVGGRKIAKKVLKATTWNGTDNYGFSALPGGHRYEDIFHSNGAFARARSFGYWRTASDGGVYVIGWSRKINYINISIPNMDLREFGFSVRCVCDE
jgi:uncharacterized protein (TIGR02145 family)